MYTSRVEKILKGLSKNLSVHNVPFHPIFVFILIKNQFITHISSIKSLLLNLGGFGQNGGFEFRQSFG